MGAQNSTEPRPSLGKQLIKSRMSIKTSEREVAKIEKQRQKYIEEAEQAFSRGDLTKAKLYSQQVVLIDKDINKIIKIKLQLEAQLRTITLTANMNTATENLKDLTLQLEQCCTPAQTVENFSTINDKMQDIKVAHNTIENDIDNEIIDEVALQNVMDRIQDSATESLVDSVPDVSQLVKQDMTQEPSNVPHNMYSSP